MSYIITTIDQSIIIIDSSDLPSILFTNHSGCVRKIMQFKFDYHKLINHFGNYTLFVIFITYSQSGNSIIWIFCQFDVLSLFMSISSVGSWKTKILHNLENIHFNEIENVFLHIHNAYNAIFAICNEFKLLFRNFIFSFAVVFFFECSFGMLIWNAESTECFVYRLAGYSYFIEGFELKVFVSNPKQYS